MVGLADEVISISGVFCDAAEEFSLVLNVFADVFKCFDNALGELGADFSGLGSEFSAERVNDKIDNVLSAGVYIKGDCSFSNGEWVWEDCTQVVESCFDAVNACGLAGCFGDSELVFGEAAKK